MAINIITGIELTPEMVQLKRGDDKSAMSEMTEASCAPCDNEQPDFSKEDSLLSEGVSMVRSLKGDVYYE